MSFTWHQILGAIMIGLMAIALAVEWVWKGVKALVGLIPH
jgi:hypothetical protein